MSPRLLFLIVFIEGYCSLGAEVIALRRLIPHVGSAIVVTAPTIGFFLLALAFGYQAGSRVATDYRALVARNMTIAAALLGVGLTGRCVDLMFTGAPSWLAYLVFIGGVLCPLAWLLGQTVPILTNLSRAQRSGEAAGRALHGSTLGSFLGSVTLSLGMMQGFGVWSAVLLSSLLLAVGALLTLPPRGTRGLVPAGMVVLVLASAWLDHDRADTAHADYAVRAVTRAGMVAPRAFSVNNQTASLIDASSPPVLARYIERLRHILLDELRFRDKSILVLGAGGFTLSYLEPANRYTYVDIDPAIRTLAERDFLKAPIQGEFVVADARRHVASTPQRHDAVVVDVYSALTAIPGHLVTREFWRDARRVLHPDGVLLANLILDGHLASAYARNLLATMESVLGRCGVEVLDKHAESSNVIVVCFPGEQAEAIHLYVDERNLAEWDRRLAP